MNCGHGQQAGRGQDLNGRHLCKDPAEWNTASFSQHPIDAMEPVKFSGEHQSWKNEVLMVFNGIDEWMCSTHSGKPPPKWYPASLALGLRSTRGRTETSVAAELGKSRACVSKAVVKVLQLTGLEDNPAWGLKSPESRKIYKRTNGRRRAGIRSEPTN